MIRSRLPTRILLSTLASILILTACAKTPETAVGTATPDPCASENVLAAATQVNDLMPEFDDGADLASHLAANQLVSVIPSLQEVRRRAEDQQTPGCLSALKTLQVAYMNTVIDTLLSFVSGATSDQLVQGIARARLQHEDYNRELARVLGATYVPPATQPAVTAPPATATLPGPSATPSAWVTNPGTGPVNIRAQPRSDADLLGTLNSGLSMVAVGRSADGQWIQVADSLGNTGWVYAAIVSVVGLQTLPIVTPAP